MPLKKSPGWFLILLVLPSACGPMVPLSYDPNDPPASIAQTIDSPEVTITLEYFQLQYGYYIFDLEVTNHSSAAIQLAPQAISFYASRRLFPSLKNPTDDVHALSAPNSSLVRKRAFGRSPIAIRSFYQQKAKEKEAASIFLAILSAGLIIYDGVKDSHDGQKETWTKKDQQNAAGRDLLVNVAIAASQVAQAQAYEAGDDNYYIPYELFPECRIEPDSSVRGKVYIQSEGSYRYARLVVPLAETDYVFDLKRLVVKPLNFHH